METSRRSRWRPRRVSHVHKENTRLPKVWMDWMDVTTAVLESTAMFQVLPAPALAARHARKDGFKMYQGLSRAILARALLALDLATKD